MTEPCHPPVWSLSRPAVFVEAMTLAEQNRRDRCGAPGESRQRETRPAGRRPRLRGLASPLGAAVAAIMVLSVAAVAGLIP